MFSIFEQGTFLDIFLLTQPYKRLPASAGGLPVRCILVSCPCMGVMCLASLALPASNVDPIRRKGSICLNK